MIDQVDSRLRDWVASVVGAIPVSFAAPDGTASGPHVGMYLLEVVHQPPPRGIMLPPLRVSLRYLLTTWSPDPDEAHRLLGQLIFAAMDYKGFDVEPDALPVQVWSALGVPPRPSCVLRVALSKERVQPRAKAVREFSLRSSSTVVLQGVVLGPGHTPIAGARVEIPTLNRHTQTDYAGRFRLEAVPAEPRATALLIRAKGRDITMHTGDFRADEPLLIELQGLEG